MNSGNCNAYGKDCELCGKPNHFTECCWEEKGKGQQKLSSSQSKKKPVQQRGKHKERKAHEVKANDSEEEEDDFDVLVTDEVTGGNNHLPVNQRQCK